MQTGNRRTKKQTLSVSSEDALKLAQSWFIAAVRARDLQESRTFGRLANSYRKRAACLRKQAVALAHENELGEGILLHGQPV